MRFAYAAADTIRTIDIRTRGKRVFENAFSPFRKPPFGVFLGGEAEPLEPDRPENFSVNPDPIKARFSDPCLGSGFDDGKNRRVSAHDCSGDYIHRYGILSRNYEAYRAGMAAPGAVSLHPHDRIHDREPGFDHAA